MNSTRSVPTRFNNYLLYATRAVQVLVAAGIALFISSFVFLFGVRLLYTDKALPGVHVAGINLSGMNYEQITNALGQALTYPETGLIVLRDGEQVWTVRPSELGVLIDVPAMSRHALSVGRQGTLALQLQEQIDAWHQGHPVAPIILFDYWVGSFYLQGIAEQIDRPTIEAELMVRGTDVTASPGQIGRRLDIEATLNVLNESVTHFHDADLTLIVEDTLPLVLDASEQAAVARAFLTQPLTLTAADAGPWILDPTDLANMIRFNLVQEDGEAGYDVVLDAGALAAVLEPLSQGLERDPENARFIFNDDTGELDLMTPAVIGRTLDVSKTIEAVNNGLRAGLHEIPLSFILDDPVVTDDATAESLGIHEPVSVVSTYFSGSSSERIQNIKTASGAFHGLLVAPGETLSMADVLGDISLDNGYAEALIIYGNRTIKGVGGGVCQVSTTLFRAVFFGGYPIVERHPHAYRVSYYEQGPASPGTGLDATVFVPIVDFKFTNDTPNWLLLETYIYGNQLLWKFYSTSDERTVEWSRQISNKIEAPKPLYKENPDLKKNEIKQIDYEADGMDVVVYRTVTRNGETLYQDTIKTRYLPWRAIFEFGPGSKLPKGVEVEKE
ncbi:MAG: hypothetical protein GTO14_25315 [Anaerolineales bacterium]|nr:hypothetical protein [Anaerolineales bacterium]